MAHEIKIKIPAVQTIILMVLLVGAVTAIVWASVAVHLETPPPQAPPVVQPAEGPAAWLSAWSTFWGATASGIGAIGTAGALLIAAFSYKHQVEEKARQADERRRDAEERRQQADERRQDAANQRRAQAMQVSILTPDSKVHSNTLVLQVHNGSPLPIKDVLLMCFNYSGRESGQWYQQVIAGGMTQDMMEQSRKVVDRVWASFEDASGQKWKVHINGELEEL